MYFDMLGISFCSEKYELLLYVYIYRRPEKFLLISGESCLFECLFVNASLGFPVNSFGQEYFFFFT